MDTIIISANEKELIGNVARDLFGVLPLLRKKLLHLDTIQADHGIPLSHVQVLSMLSDTGSLSVSEISKRLGIAKPNITPLVDRLIESGLVDRQRDTIDRRVVNIVILEEGRRKLESIHETVVGQVNEWRVNMPIDKIVELSEALKTVSTILTSAND